MITYHSVLRLLWILFLCLCLHCALTDGKATCSQSGIGPSDMYMSNGSMNKKYMWSKVRGKVHVPVAMDPTYNAKERGVILGGLIEIEQRTCVEFYIYKNEAKLKGHDYVYITRSKGRGCWSYVGRIGRGKQDLSLPTGCITHRTAMHEMMHALGFSHEHVRSDRDEYVHIFWGNIQPGRERNFEKKNSHAHGPYDYDSIMHYEKNAFSMNGMDTVRPTRAGVRIGVRQKMSKWDAKKINHMYSCDASGGGYHGSLGLGYSPESSLGHDNNVEPSPEEFLRFPQDSSSQGDYNNNEGSSLRDLIPYRNPESSHHPEEHSSDALGFDHADRLLPSKQASPENFVGYPRHARGSRRQRLDDEHHEESPISLLEGYNPPRGSTGIQPSPRDIGPIGYHRFDNPQDSPQVEQFPLDSHNGPSDGDYYNESNDSENENDGNISNDNNYDYNYSNGHL